MLLEDNIGRKRDGKVAESTAGEINARFVFDFYLQLTGFKDFLL